MRALRIPAAILLFAVLAVGCNEQKVPTASTDVLRGASFNYTNNPDAGPIIVRIALAGEPVLILQNEEESLLSMHASDNSLDNCVPATEWETIDQQLVFPPGNDRFHASALTEDFVTVYDFTGSPPVDCDLLTGATGRLLAQGRVHFVGQFNVPESFEPEGWDGKWSASGNLDNVQGGKVAYHLFWKFDDLVPIRQVGPRLKPDPRN